MNNSVKIIVDEKEIEALNGSIVANFDCSGEILFDTITHHNKLKINSKLEVIINDESVFSGCIQNVITNFKKDEIVTSTVTGYKYNYNN